MPELEQAEAHEGPCTALDRDCRYLSAFAELMKTTGVFGARGYRRAGSFAYGMNGRMLDAYFGSLPERLSVVWSVLLQLSSRARARGSSTRAPMRAAMC